MKHFASSSSVSRAKGDVGVTLVLRSSRGSSQVLALMKDEEINEEMSLILSFSFYFPIKVKPLL